MNITEVRVRLREGGRDRLLAFCTVTIDQSLVIRDIKIIDGPKGLFVAMPSRKLMDRCPRCGSKNQLRAAYCNGCGGALAQDRAGRDTQGRAKLHADVAHPINAAAREELQRALIGSYRAELERSKLPGYVPPAIEEDETADDVTEEAYELAGARAQASRPRASPGGRPETAAAAPLERTPMREDGACEPAALADDDFSRGIFGS